MGAQERQPLHELAWLSYAARLRGWDQLADEIDEQIEHSTEKQATIEQERERLFGKSDDDATAAA